MRHNRNKSGRTERFADTVHIFLPGKVSKKPVDRAFLADLRRVVMPQRIDASLPAVRRV